MGLVVSHGCWAGSCFGFCRWREAVAEVAQSRRPLHYDPLLLMDPIVVLLEHPVDRGHLEPSEAHLLAARLEQVVPFLDDTGGEGSWGLLDLRQMTERFIVGLRQAVHEQQPVRFQMHLDPLPGVTPLPDDNVVVQRTRNGWLARHAGRRRWRTRGRR